MRESLAAHFLSRRRARIVARNVRVGRGEIDLVIALGGQRIAVEVKTVQTGGLDDPAYAFTPSKAAQVRFLANQLGIPQSRPGRRCDPAVGYRYPLDTAGCLR